MIRLEWSIEKKHFDDGAYREYRIPGVAVTPGGTILLVCEARTDENSDWGRIDVLLERSDDDGRTWQTMRIAPWNGLAVGPDDTFNNPVLIVDGDRVHLIFHKNYALAYRCTSLDEGRSWSQPEEITDAFREFEYPWNVCATGPGHGIRLRSGRLVAPVWLADGAPLEGHRRAHWPSVAGSIYSDDRGETWHAGALLRGFRDPNETAVAERADGSVLFNFRSREPALRRILAVSPDGASGFEEARICGALNDPMCFGGMAALDDGHIAFVHCDVGRARPGSDFGARTDLRVHVTADGGGTWQPLLDVDPVGGYADLAYHDGCLYVFCERGEGGVIRRLTLNKYRL